MPFRNRTYIVIFIALTSVLWHSCKDPLPVVFQQDKTDQISPYESLSTPNPISAMLTTVDSSGWRIIDTAYSAIAILSDVRYDLDTIHSHIVMSKLILQDKTRPVKTPASMFIGFRGVRCDTLIAGDVPMRPEIRRNYTGNPDTALGYQYTALNENGMGPDPLEYHPGSLFNWTIRVPGRPTTYFGGIPSDIIRLVRPSPDSVERIDKGTDYTVKWTGPNGSVDLIISEITGNPSQGLTFSLKQHVNFQRATSDTVVVTSEQLDRLAPGLYMFTLSASSEVPAEINGVPIAIRSASVHNVMVRLR